MFEKRIYAVIRLGIEPNVSRPTRFHPNAYFHERRLLRLEKDKHPRLYKVILIPHIINTFP